RLRQARSRGMVGSLQEENGPAVVVLGFQAAAWRNVPANLARTASGALFLAARPGLLFSAWREGLASPFGIPQIGRGTAARRPAPPPLRQTNRGNPDAPLPHPYARPARQAPPLAAPACRPAPSTGGAGGPAG